MSGNDWEETLDAPPEEGIPLDVLILVGVAFPRELGIPNTLLWKTGRQATGQGRKTRIREFENVQLSKKFNLFF